MHLVSSGTSGLCNVLCPCHFRTTAFWLASVMLFLEANVVHVLNNTMLSLPNFDNCSYFVVFHFFRSSSNQLFETRFLNFIDHVIFFWNCFCFANLCVVQNRDDIVKNIVILRAMTDSQELFPVRGWTCGKAKKSILWSSNMVQAGNHLDIWFDDFPIRK